MKQSFTREVLENPFYTPPRTSPKRSWAAEGLWQPQWARHGREDVDLAM